MKEKFDFSGWATKNDLRCSDGRTIRRDAFKDQDGQTVPLVWHHKHDNPMNVLGHALLENRPEGVYAYCKFNETESGQNAKMLVEHGDVNALSIYANQLKQQQTGDVLHGVIREVSLVLAGANPGALIDFPVLEHGEESETEAVIYTGEGLSLSHATEDEGEKKEGKVKEDEGEEKMADNKEKTVKDVFDSMTEEQKNVVYFMIGQALEQAGVDASDDEDEEIEHDGMGGEDFMKHNVFDNEIQNEDVLSHEAMETIIKDGKRYGSLRDSFMAHADEYGITNIEYLFPKETLLDNAPGFVKRPTEWVTKVMNSVHRTPFSRIKSIYAQLTEDQARAKGYLKKKQKKEEVFSLLKRTTSPQTIYKKQKLDRDDVVDITDFDVVAWLKTEMRIMLDEEIARAILVGDGRQPSDDDKIFKEHIMPIAEDEALYAIPVNIQTSTEEPELANVFIKESLRARKNYQGTGNPTLFINEDMLTELLLLEDKTGRPLYDDMSKLATKLRVKEIVSIPSVIFGEDLHGIFVNLADYNVGADKGGAVNMFDDFDIDYNQQKYLIETRCSGALVVPYSAIVVKSGTAASGEDDGE